VDQYCEASINKKDQRLGSKKEGLKKERKSVKKKREIHIEYVADLEK